MSEPASWALRTQNLTKIYHNNRIALNGVDLEVETGTVLGILGGNGAGKTTLVRLLMGLHVPSAGQVFVLGKPMGPNAGAVRRRMGYLPADPRFPPKMTPLAYLKFVGDLAGLKPDDCQARMAHLIRAVGLHDPAGQRIDRLSSGQVTRLALAVSLINDPDILIWDEPGQGLDPEARRGILELIGAMGRSKTILLCSHHIEDLQEVCDRAILMHQGQIIHDGTVESLRGQMKPQQLEIRLLGDRKTMTEAFKTIQLQEGLEHCKLTRGVLRLHIQEGQSHAGVLSAVLATLSDHGVDFADLKIDGQSALGGMSDLCQQEERRGLTRAYQSPAS